MHQGRHLNWELNNSENTSNAENIAYKNESNSVILLMSI